MLHIEIKPLFGITIEEKGKLCLGQSRKEVEHLIGLPDKSDTVSVGNISTHRAFYHTYEFRLDYDYGDKVEAIEFIYGPSPENTEISIYGVNPFEVEADKLIEILSTFNAGDIDTTEAPYCYAFKDISVGVWRDSSPAAAEELIEEMKANNRNEVDESWLADELRKAYHFWTIGIGRKGYYQS